MVDAYKVVRQFEEEVAIYAGSKFCVSANSCTNAVFLSLMYQKSIGALPSVVDCPAYTYVGIPQHIVHAGAKIRWRHEEWQDRGWYKLYPTPVIDAARLTTSKMYVPGSLMCLSLHWSKTLSASQGGVILTDDADAAAWLKRARFDGRSEGVAPNEDEFIQGWHCYLSPEVAAQALVKLSFLPKDNAPLPECGYPDLSKAKVFQPHTVV